MMKKTLTSIFFMFIIMSCTTTTEQTKTEENKIAKNDDIKVGYYGKNKEIQAVSINNKDYYTVNVKNVEKLTEDEIKKLNITAPLKVTEETVKGNRGIVITYYDIKIFLGATSGASTKVGLFEPQYNAWTIGNDMDDSQDIEIELSNKSKATISIRKGSISLSYK